MPPPPTINKLVMITTQKAYKLSTLWCVLCCCTSYQNFPVTSYQLIADIYIISAWTILRHNIHTYNLISYKTEQFTKEVRHNGIEKQSSSCIIIRSFSMKEREMSYFPRP